ncbi:glycerol-3-phosphate cytidylyltransferase [Bacteroidia bacterium]|nr:glycerol-3-phosphate cytidylyltransferase [Bacteroidia bacterium]
MKKVFTVGVFDVFHYGHLRLFARAKVHGDYLIVAVQDSEDILRYKPDALVVYNTEQRLELVSNIKYVDSAIVYHAVDEIVKQIDFDVFCVGEDQTHEGFQRAVEYCCANGKEVVILERTKNVSSSSLKTKIENLFL